MAFQCSSLWIKATIRWKLGTKTYFGARRRSSCFHVVSKFCCSHITAQNISLLEAELSCHVPKSIKCVFQILDAHRRTYINKCTCCISPTHGFISRCISLLCIRLCSAGWGPCFRQEQYRIQILTFSLMDTGVADPDKNPVTVVDNVWSNTAEIFLLPEVVPDIDLDNIRIFLTSAKKWPDHVRFVSTPLRWVGISGWKFLEFPSYLLSPDAWENKRTLKNRRWATRSPWCWLYQICSHCRQYTLWTVGHLW